MEHYPRNSWHPNFTDNLMTVLSLTLFSLAVLSLA
jgi:hypothetical protein